MNKKFDKCHSCTNWTKDRDNFNYSICLSCNGSDNYIPQIKQFTQNQIQKFFVERILNKKCIEVWDFNERFNQYFNIQ